VRLTLADIDQQSRRLGIAALMIDIWHRLDCIMQKTSSVERCYAHTLADQPPANWETLAAHLRKVAESASAFAHMFGAFEWGDVLGCCHDLGKLSDDFQSYLHSGGAGAEEAGAEEDNPGKRVDHSTFGARYVAEVVGKVQGQLLAFCIAGHHTGLPDETSDEDGGQRATLRHKLDPKKYPIPAVDVPALILPDLKLPIRPMGDFGFPFAFFTRMLFSCLIDADRTRTEEFCSPEDSAQRSRMALARPGLSKLRDALDVFLQAKQAGARPSEVNRQRKVVLNQCRAAAQLQPGFFSLNVPTGGGKTLSSLAFALEHALQPNHDLRRVVMAIPFTSIIEQTADVYRQALGSLAESALVEHHTNLQPVRDTRANQLGTENWDAPLIVTTNVQLLESLFAYRTTRCRKLHNLARSVIVLDEAQTIPVELLKPALAALRELVLNNLVILGL
jgi:CRISPR-associated endonuclease/helicase Cas3